MAVDKNKITAEATKLVQKGQFDKAIRAYQRILQSDPKDVRVLLKVGELQQKKGDNAAAAETFNRVADAYGEQGFFLKAVAVYKQIVKLTPDDTRVNERLAGLYQQLGLMSDAMGQLQIVAAGHEKAGDGARLLDVLRRMVELDPDNVASSIKLGELYAKAGQGGEALELFRRAAAELKSNNRIDEYLKVSERIAFLAPDDAGLTRELASIYLAKGDTKRALAKLQLCFKADPRDIETLNMLAQAFRDLGQTGKTISVFKELARAYEEQGRSGDARATYQRILELAPGDHEAAEALGARQAPAAPQPPPARAPPPAPAAVAPPRPPAPSAAQKPLGLEGFARVITEAEVYVKYGLHQKALEHVSRILAVDPDEPDALEKVRDIHVASGNRPAAAEAALKAARACVTRGLGDRTARAIERLREIDPGHPDLGMLYAAAGLPEPEGAEAAVVRMSDVESVGTDSVRLVPESGADLLEEELAPTTDETALAAAAAALDDEGETIPEEPPPPRRAPPPGRPPGAARPPAAAAAPPPDLSDELEEADFYSEQGLDDEAREMLKGLLARHPGHAAVKERLLALDRNATRAAPRQEAAAGRPAAPAPVDDGAFDIARELADELGPPGATASAADDFQYSVEEVFDQFKKGVAETVKPEDTETHYDLGIAYKEMGLLDDAIHEFEMALSGHSKKKEVDCLTMIGLCQRAKGEHRTALEAFRRALRSGALTAVAAKALHYELAAAHEALGQPEQALWYLQKIHKVDPGYREAGAAVARLGGGPGRPPADLEARAAARAGAAPPRPGERPGAKKNIGYV
ncbi:MAG TPA: tetratricopeptide repeat protein [Anaeromyxobacteraceae bacterium]|nr:tetratricopeptide repeat protein [Anaeromyxobacteraceae bacterium]